MVIVGFGETETTSALGGTIDGTSLDSLAFSVPRDGVITSLSGFFTVTVAASYLDIVNVTGQLYVSSTPDNLFAPVPGAFVTLSPGVTGLVPIGMVFHGTNDNLSIPISAGSRLMLVFQLTSSPGLVLSTATGTFSGGITIE